MEEAVCAGDVDAVREFLKNGWPVDEENLMQRTLLHLAAGCNKTAVMEVLLEAGAGASTRDRNKETPLHLAAERGHLDAVKLLIKSGADLDAQNVGKHTPLHMAVERKHASVAEALVGAGAALDIKNVLKQTPLVIACKNCDTDVARILLEAGCELKKLPHKLLYEATRSHTIPLMTLLLKHGADPNGLNYRSTTEKPISSAVCCKDMTLVKILMDAGASVLPIPHCRFKTSLLHTCALVGSAEIMEVMLQAGVPINHKDSNGSTPLHASVSKNRPECVRLLVERGADLNLAQWRGCTPLHIAAYDNRPELVAILLEAGCQLHQREIEGKTALEFASQHKDGVVVGLIKAEVAKRVSKSCNCFFECMETISESNRLPDEIKDKIIKIVLEDTLSEL
eukprot:Colp12_sorted_trinity150504_noHs@2440